ncbi:MAG: hypothetical protein Pg6B_10770 [Candidatus Azobacteroides pseudotrichonymphae]|jgi:hypothetical protein|nr:MAG: hypothetical protein Pg6B_10770 [Candidatus Azobacteroides pseudotrichonymphae]
MRTYELDLESIIEMAFRAKRLQRNMTEFLEKHDEDIRLLLTLHSFGLKEWSVW